MLIQLLVVNYCLGQNDASHTYIDLIAKNNQCVMENRNQKIINWDEVPFKIDGISRFKQIYYSSQIDTSISADTSIIIDSKIENAVKLYSQVYDFEHLSNDTVAITIDSSFVITYEKDKIVSQQEEGKKMFFNYYTSGLLNEVWVDSSLLIQSNQESDTTKYNLNLLDPITNKPFQSEFVPTISVECIQTDNKCFHYKNIYLHKKMAQEPIVNKEIVQCANGNVTFETILDRYKNYTQKEKEYDFVYDSLLLRKKICKTDIEYSEYNNIDYEYDNKNNLKRIIGSTITSEFKYDEKNNIIMRLDYFSGTKSLQKFWIREIEYKE